MMWDMPRDAVDLRRLAKAVTLRRTALRLSVDEAARRAPMSNTTWHRVEDGLSVRDTSYSRVDGVLDWPPGTCRQVIEDPSFQPFATETAQGARYSSPTIDEAVAQVIQRATIATVPDVTGAQIVELQERAVEELRRRGLLRGA